MIRLAEFGDLDSIMTIYSVARKYMADSGNPTQWGDRHPPRELIEEDIHEKRLYVYMHDCGVHGVFVLITTPEPTYEHIEGGWKNDEPYGTIHRIASSGQVRGVFAACLDFCTELLRSEQIYNLRIDTHSDNLTMRHLIEKHGFERCGTVYMRDGSPRIAYQRTI